MTVVAIRWILELDTKIWQRRGRASVVRARERQENEKEGAFNGWWEEAASFQQYDGV